MTSRAAVLIVVLSVSLLGCARSTHPTPDAAAPQGTPASTATRCWMLDRIYPVTDLALNAQKLTQAERREVKMWAARVSPEKQFLVRWIRDPRDRAIYIFIAEPERPGTETEWVALNTNIAIAFHQCEFYALPGA